MRRIPTGTQNINLRTIEPVAVGILGCGHVSYQYFEGCARFGVLRLVACADVDSTRAEEKAAEYSVRKAYSPPELIDDPEVEVVINLTPPQIHAETTLMALEAGKHVWSEKPLAKSMEAAAPLMRAAKDAGVLLGCAPDTFLGGGLQTSRKLVDDGWIGTPVAAVAFVSEHGYEHFHPNVDSFYGPGGGPALDLGPYYVTALVNLLGPVARVAGFTSAAFSERTILAGTRLGQKVPVQVPTHVTGAIEFESGVVATVLMSWDIWSTHLPYLEIYGSAGSLSVANPDEFDGLPRVRRAGVEELREPPPPPGSLPWSAVPLAYEGDVGRGIGVADMAYAIRTGRPHRASGDLAYHVLEVLCAFERSTRERRHIDIESRCSRPASLPLALPKGQLDGLPEFSQDSGNPAS